MSQAKPPRMIDVIVTVDDDHLDAIDEVVEALRRRGLRADQVAGVTISGETADVDSLHGVDGVRSVEQAQKYQLPRPDAEIQ